MRQLASCFRSDITWSFYAGELERRWNDALAQFQAGAQAASADPRKAKERIVYLKRITELWLVQGKTEQAYQSAGEVLRVDPGDSRRSWSGVSVASVRLVVADVTEYDWPFSRGWVGMIMPDWLSKSTPTPDTDVG